MANRIRSKRSDFLFTLVCLMLVFGLSFDVEAKPKKIRIRFAHIYTMNPSVGAHVWINKFRELCDNHFPGRFNIEEYGVSSLYKVTESSKAAAAGSVEVGYWSSGAARFALPPKSREPFNTTLMPMLYNAEGPITVQMHSDFMSGRYWKELAKKHIEPLGAYCKGYWCGNQSFMVAFMKPVTTLEGFKNKKIRGIGDWLVKLIKKLGANPIAISTSEVPGALLTGALDGAMSWTGPIWRNKWYKTAQYLLPVKLLPTQIDGGWWWNKRWWDKLPKDVTAKFDEFIVECDRHLQETISLPTEYNREELYLADGAKIPTWEPKEVDKVHKMVLQKLREEWMAECGPESKKIMGWAEEIAKKYTPEVRKKYEDKYKGKIYPPGWEHLAKK